MALDPTEERGRRIIVERGRGGETYGGSKGVVPEDGGLSWWLLSDVDYHHHRQREGLYTDTGER